MKATKSTAIWLKILAVIWMVWVFLDYWFKHPLYVKSFGSSFVGIAVMHVLVAVIGFFVIQKFLSGRTSILLMIFLFFGFLWSGTLVNLMMYSDVAYTTQSVLLYFGRTLLFIGLVLVVMWSAYLAGSKIITLTPLDPIEIPSSIKAALGLCVFMMLMFVLLSVGLFSPWSIGAVFVLPVLLSLSDFKAQIRVFTDTLEDTKPLSALGIICVILLILMNAITFAHTLSPFPTGFDALNHYINLPKLMAEAGHLIKGYQPYNWSLLQAAAVKLTGRIELALVFSWMGLILVQWATFEFGKKVMKLSAAYSLLGVVFFTYMPSVTTQASQELKVDLGLTFILIAMIMTGFLLLNRLSFKTDKKGVYSLAIIVGILGGFALGIKLTAVIALFAMVAILWYKNLGKTAFFGVFFICLAIVFLAQLDSIAGLRVYHHSVRWLQYVSLILGIGLLLFSMRNNIKLATKTAVLTIVMASSAGLVFIPWMAKNYMEVKDASFMQIINGANHGPVFNMNIIDQNLKNKSK